MTIEFTGDDVKSARDVSGVTGDSIGQNTGTIKHGYNFGSVTKGISAYYPFDDDASDQSGLGNDGTVNGATFISDGGPFGTGAYSFDGTDDYIDTNWNASEISGSANRTYSWWLNPDDVGGDEAFLAHGVDNTGERIVLRTDDTNNDNLRIEIGGSAYKSNISIENGVWQHFAAVLNGDTLGDFTLYKNGVPEGASGAGSINTGTTEDLWIGSADNVLPGAFTTYDGLMSDVRIYDRALSAPEIEALYNISSPSTITPEDTLQ